MEKGKPDKRTGCLMCVCMHAYREKEERQKG